MWNYWLQPAQLPYLLVVLVRQAVKKTRHVSHMSSARPGAPCVMHGTHLGTTLSCHINATGAA